MDANTHYDYFLSRGGGAVAYPPLIRLAGIPNSARNL